MFRNMKWFVFLTLLSSIAVANEDDDYQEKIKALLASRSAMSGLSEPIHVQDMVINFYRIRRNVPAWTDPQQVKAVLATLQESFDEGLLPDDYHYSTLLALYNRNTQNTPLSDNEKIQFELLLTDGVLLYALHLRHGKVNPANFETSWNYKQRKLLPKKEISAFEKNIERGSVAQSLNDLKPQVEIYQQLKNGLALYRKIQKEDPFVVIESTPLLRIEGSQSDVIPVLRQRLISMQLLDANEASSNIYDAKLIEAVKLFQLLHGMVSDGVVGFETWPALNMSWQERIDKIRINLERTRWVYENTTNNFVIVNIAGFQLYLVRDKKVAWQTAVMTGDVDHETPLFMSRFSYMILNPTWTVPTSILQSSLIYKMKANPAYLQENDFILLNRHGEVNPKNLDWSTLNSNNFHYTVVQQPGDLNALGKVKFMFPNTHSIYLHDTPAKSLFSRTARAFSHGCVRVENPLELARLLMNAPDEWTEEKFAKIVASKKTTRISIDTPTEVMLMYWTTEPFADGNIKFNPDIYSRDPRVLTALDTKAP